MKRILPVLVCAACAWTLAAQEASVPRKDFDLFAGTTWWRETIEWGAIGSGFALSEFVLHEAVPWSPDPLLPSAPRYWGEGEARAPDIKTKSFYEAGIALGAAILLVPNRNGFINHDAYRHFKGYFEANLALIPLVTSLVRHALPKDKPSYAQTVQEGGQLKVSDSMSFWAPDAAASFGIATYAGLFVMNDLGTGQAADLFWKLPVLAGLGGLAVYASGNVIWSHGGDPLDVAAGAVAGALMSTLVYGMHANWFGPFYP
jgi:hypothetical protein